MKFCKCNQISLNLVKMIESVMVSEKVEAWNTYLIAISEFLVSPIWPSTGLYVASVFVFHFSFLRRSLVNFFTDHRLNFPKGISNMLLIYELFVFVQKIFNISYVNGFMLSYTSIHAILQRPFV